MTCRTDFLRPRINSSNMDELCIFSTLAKMKTQFQLILATLLLGLSTAVEARAVSLPGNAQPSGGLELERELTSALITRAQAKWPTAEIDVRPLRVAPIAAAKTCIDPQHELSRAPVLGRISVRIRCHGEAPWSYYRQFEVGGHMSALHARQAIARGATITTEDLELRAVTLGANSSFLSSIEAVVGQRASRPIAMGRPLTSRHVSAPLAVQKGDRVQIRATRAKIMITSSGIALKSGYVGEQIPVRNESSDRLIHTWISGRGRVDTHPGL